MYVLSQLTGVRSPLATVRSSQRQVFSEHWIAPGLAEAGEASGCGTSCIFGWHCSSIYVCMYVYVCIYIYIYIKLIITQILTM